MIGKTIGSYKVVARLGGGGMGEVWKAFDPKLQRTVAIKILKDQSDDAARRILTEARAASALNHPHICTIHDIGEHDGHPFIVMEYLKGQTLKHRISDSPIDTEEL